MKSQIILTLLLIINSLTIISCDPDDNDTSATEYDHDSNFASDPDSSSDEENDSDSDSDSGNNTNVTLEADNYAMGITLNNLEFNQVVAVDVALSGEPVDVENQSSILIKERPGLFRATWSLQDDWEPRNIQAWLVLHYPNNETIKLINKKFIDGPPDMSTIEGTFSWILTSEQVQPDMEYSITLYESEPAATNPETLPRIPQEDTALLGISSKNMEIDITVIPLNCWGVTAVVDEEQMDCYKNALMALNPVSKINLTLHDLHDFNSCANYTTLPMVNDLRNSENADPWQYYQAISSDPLAGISYLADPVVNAMRVSVLGATTEPSFCNASFPDAEDMTGWSVGTHELGHGQGRVHSPGCGAPLPDKNAPSQTSRQGFNIIDNQLIEENQFDYMSYCNPVWVSAYVYNSIAERVALLTNWKYNGFKRSFSNKMILSGILEISDDVVIPHWHVTFGSPSKLLPWKTTEMTVKMLDGTTHTQIGYELQESENAYMFNASLPANQSQIDKIYVWINGKKYLVPSNVLQN